MASSPILGIHHVGIVAHGAAALASFYEQAATLQRWSAVQALPLPGAGIALAGPNAGLRLLEGGGPAQRRPVSEAGLTHVCLQSPALPALRDAFAAAGAAFHCPPIDLGTGFLYTYARDPEHNVTELEGVAPVWAESRPWLAHVNVACADLSAQCAFYAALLGAAAARSPRLRGNPLLDRIADLDSVELRMAWIPAGNAQVELISYSAPAAVASTLPSRRREPGASGHAYIAFEVEHLDAACKHLQACGGTVATAPVGDAPLATGADGEGNPLWLIERGWLMQHSASFSQLPQPDIVARFDAARARLQGTP
jgi:catechol 2,3-dioxygenase-like lactoylglutathione lyase family enzyme